MRFARCMPSCARPTISPMMSPFPSPSGASRWMRWLGELAPGAGRRADRGPGLHCANGRTARFAIPPQLLDQLVQGTATDLEPIAPSMPGAFAAYATFADLYRYCYLVASVVGLVCIRIFGYLDSRAEKLAEETGIAFQLTNILRDVREDAQRGRLYLPLEDLERCGVTAGSMTGNLQWAAVDAGAAPGARHPGGARRSSFTSPRRRCCP